MVEALDWPNGGVRNLLRSDRHEPCKLLSRSIGQDFDATLTAAFRRPRIFRPSGPDCGENCPGVSYPPEAMRTFGR